MGMLERKLKPAIAEALIPLYKEIMEFTHKQAKENQEIMVRKVDELKQYIDRIVHKEVKEQLRLER